MTHAGRQEEDDDGAEEGGRTHFAAQFLEALQDPDVATALAKALRPIMTPPASRGRGRPPKLNQGWSGASTDEGSQVGYSSGTGSSNTPLCGAAELAACRMAVKDLMETVSVSIIYIYLYIVCCV